MQSIIDDNKPGFEKILDNLKEDLSTLNVGRANPMMVENIMVESYGAKTAIKQLASIAVPEARTITIQPWDKAIIKEIEKAIIAADIGISPVNEGSQIRIVIPQLTEESRLRLTKSVGEKIERARISIRQVRDKVKESIVKKEKAKEITEDDKYDLQKKLDELVKDYNDRIKESGEKKEEEIMTL